jgi:hypothetical protein
VRLLRAVAHAVEHRALRLGRRALAAEHVHRRPREVVEPAGMIEVQVREHDVPHVARVEAELLDLPYRGHLLAQLGLHQEEEEARQPTPRIRDVAQSVAGVDEHQPARRLEEETVRRQPPTDRVEREAVHEQSAQRTSRDAVEVMHAHGNARVQVRCPRRCRRARN